MSNDVLHPADCDTLSSIKPLNGAHPVPKRNQKKYLKQGKNYLYQISWRSSKTTNGTPYFFEENLKILPYLCWQSLSNVSSQLEFGLGRDAFYFIAAVLKTHFYL